MADLLVTALHHATGLRWRWSSSYGGFRLPKGVGGGLWLDEGSEGFFYQLVRDGEPASPPIGQFLQTSDVSARNREIALAVARRLVELGVLPTVLGDGDVTRRPGRRVVLIRDDGDDSCEGAECRLDQHAADVDEVDRAVDGVVDEDCDDGSP